MAPNSNSTVRPSGRNVTRTSLSGGMFPSAFVAHCSCLLRINSTRLAGSPTCCYLNSAGAKACGAATASSSSSPAAFMVLPRMALDTAASIINSAKWRVAWSSATVASPIAARSSPCLTAVSRSRAVAIFACSSAPQLPPRRVLRSAFDGARESSPLHCALQ